MVFLAKFFPLGKTNVLRGRISSFQQTGMESISEAWERLQEYILAYPHHGMDEWLVLQSFYNGLTVTPHPTNSTREVENLSDETEELCSSSFFPDLCDIYLELSAVMPEQCYLNRIEP